MIIFHRLWATMESRGISMYQLREKCGIDSKTIRRLRANENIYKKLWISCVLLFIAIWMILLNTRNPKLFLSI